MSSNKSIKPKQSAFLDELFLNGFNQGEAWMKVHNVKNIETARVNAVQCLSIPSVAAEYQRRKDLIANAGIITREDIIKDLRIQIEECKIEKDRQHLIKAYDLICKMSGFYTTNINAKVDTTIKLSFGGAETPEEEDEDGND